MPRALHRPHPLRGQGRISPCDEAALIAAWQTQGDQQALASLIDRHRPLIRRLARRLGAALREDLETEGILALIEAAARYPLSSAAPFTAFALPALRGAMLRARAGQGSAVSIPERQLRDALAGRATEEKAATIREALQAEIFDETSLPLASPAAEETTLQRERHHRLRRALARAIRPLGRQERRLVLHHLLREDCELPRLAEALNISVARARSLEGRALHKMRNTLLNSGILMSDFA